MDSYDSPIRDDNIKCEGYVETSSEGAACVDEHTSVILASSKVEFERTCEANTHSSSPNELMDEKGQMLDRKDIMIFGDDHTVSNCEVKLEFNGNMEGSSFDDEIGGDDNKNFTEHIVDGGRICKSEEDCLPEDWIFGDDHTVSNCVVKLEFNGNIEGSSFVEDEFGGDDNKNFTEHIVDGGRICKSEEGCLPENWVSRCDEAQCGETLPLNPSGEKTNEFDATNESDRHLEITDVGNKCYTVDYHRALDHLPVKVENYICNICGYVTSSEDVLDSHIDSVHKNLKLQKCQLCEFTTTFKSKLKRHIDSIHLKLKNHNCHICGYTATQKAHLKAHIDSVHLKLKHHQCQLCDYTATVKSKLQRHIDCVHLKLKNHECHLCDYTSTLKCQLKNHMDSAHFTVKNQCLEVHIGAHVKLKNYKCHMCDYTATLKNSLKVHIEGVHLKLRNHECHLCDYATTKKNSLRLHIDNVHLNLRDHKV